MRIAKQRPVPLTVVASDGSTPTCRPKNVPEKPTAQGVASKNVASRDVASKALPSTELSLRDEHALIRRVAAGDRAAFEAAYRHYHPKLTRFVSRLTWRTDLVEEVVNDTLVVVWQKADRFRGDSRPSSWVLGIAYRTALKRLRKVGRMVEEELTEALRLVDPEEPEASLARRQDGERIRRALGRLTPEHRAVVELTFFGDYAYGEIAAIVGCPVNTVKTRMFHARKRLGRLLGAMNPTY